MLFRLTYAVRGYQLQYQDSIRIEVGGPHAYVVVLGHEPGEGSASGEVALEVTGDFDPPRKSAEALRDLAQGLLPADSRPEADLASEITERRLPASGRGLRFSELPNRLSDYSRDVTRELANATTQIFELIRWRRAMEGPVEALWSRGIEGVEWCDDPGNWHRLPPDFQWLAGRARILPHSTPEEIADLEAMATSGMREPLAHALLRQAQRAATQREYASALVMAIAALEIGVKQLIGTLIPGAEWLALHAPSPPVVDILRDYLPTIPADESIGGYVTSPPDDILRILKNAVSVRNVTVHRGQGELRRDFIAEVLGAVADVLWMCDYFTGQKWALRNLSEQTRSALPIPEAADATPNAAEAADTTPSAE
jgi:HEPN domain-containing protein